MISSSNAVGQVPSDSSLHSDVSGISLLFLCKFACVCIISVTFFAFGTGE